MINLLGLSLAMATSLTIFQFVSFHYSFDTLVPDRDNIYRIGTYTIISDDRGLKELNLSEISDVSIIGSEIVNDFSEVSAVTQIQLGLYLGPFNRAAPAENIWLSKPGSKDDQIKESSFAYVNSSFFEVFEFDFLSKAEGNPIGEPNSAVLSKALAEKLFNRIDVIGQSLFINNEVEVMIKGVYDPPMNSSVKFDLLLSENSSRFWERQVFIKLNDGVDFNKFEIDVKNMSHKYYELAYQRTSELNPLFEPLLQPLKEVHYARLDSEMLPTVTYEKGLFTLLLITGFLILAVAWVNTINLTISQLINKAKELNLRKIFGASRRELYMQVILEFFLRNVLAFMIAFSLSDAAQPALITYGLEYDPSVLFNNPLIWVLIPLMILLISVTALLSHGRFLSLITAPVNKKGKPNSGFYRRTVLQQILLVFQFICTSGLLIGISVVYSQTSYILDKNLGFNPENVILIRVPNTSSDRLSSKIEDFIRGCSRISGIDITASLSYPGDVSQVFGLTYRPGELTSHVTVSNGLVHPNFVDFYDIQLISGNNFEANIPSDQQILISSIKAKELGFEPVKSALNTDIFAHYFGDQLDTAKHRRMKVVGIYKDYQMTALNENPLGYGGVIFMKSPHLGDEYSFFSIRFLKGRDELKLAEVEEFYTEIFPNSPFDYSHFDDTIVSKYTNEQLVQAALIILSGLAMVISFLGLFALIAIALIHRTKEIGIRRALGASFADIFKDLSKGYLAMVIASSAISLPVVWLLSNEWLKGYSDHIIITWPMMLMPILGLTVLIMLMLIAQIYKAASANPVDSLRFE